MRVTESYYLQWLRMEVIKKSIGDVLKDMFGNNPLTPEHLEIIIAPIVRINLFIEVLMI